MVCKSLKVSCSQHFYAVLRASSAPIKHGHPLRIRLGIRWASGASAWASGGHPGASGLFLGASGFVGPMSVVQSLRNSYSTRPLGIRPSAFNLEIAFCQHLACLLACMHAGLLACLLVHRCRHVFSTTLTRYLPPRSKKTGRKSRLVLWKIWDYRPRDLSPRPQCYV